MRYSDSIHFTDFVIGFHGTDREVVEDILNGRERLEPSPRGYDWLGDGIYFWEDDPVMALWWAKRSREESLKANKAYRLPVKVETPAVIGAVIYVGECLNLAFAENQETIRQVHSSIAGHYRKLHHKLPSNDFFYRNLDCLVVNEACRALQRARGKRVDTVRGVFAGRPDGGRSTEVQRTFKGSLLFSETYKIICVRTRKVIVDYFEVDIADDE